MLLVRTTFGEYALVVRLVGETFQPGVTERAREREREGCLI